MSGRKRFFVDKINYPEQAEAVLDGEEFTHARTVQRVEEGTEIILLDGSGKEYRAIVAKVGKRDLTAHIVGVSDGEREPKEQIYLLCGALKGDKTELIVQKATELGGNKIGVFSSEYCAAYINDNKLERLKKVAREAAKQCMRSRVPEIEYFSNFESALASCKEYKNKLFACEFSTHSEVDINTLSGSVALAVGSEGGFSQAEYELSKTYGFFEITLGKRILRAETAAIALTSLVSYALGELK